MISLNDHEKQLIFDYCMGLTTQEQNAEAELLVNSNKQAEQICQSLKSILKPLESIEHGGCPDELVEGTLWRLKRLAAAGQTRLEQLIADEQTRTPVPRKRLWLTGARVAAVAAAVLFTAAIWHPVSSFARQKYWQQRCQRQLSGIFGGLSSYVADSDGQLP